jgi:hypothetical protein
MKFLNSRWPPHAVLVAAALVSSILLSSSISCVVVAFVTTYPQVVFQRKSKRHHPLSLTQGSSSNNNDDNDPNKDDAPKQQRTDTNQHVIIDELSWRVTKVRLEEANTKRLLKRKPLKLPYALSQKWIQHNYAPKTKEEFEQLVMDGDLKNVYISKRPEEYYGERGEWISWDHYLLGKCSEDDGSGSGVGGRLARNGTESNLKWQ